MKIVKRILLVLVSVILVLALFLFGFYVVSNLIDNSGDNVSMFTQLENTKYWGVVYHKDTKVMYTVSSKGEFTMLVNEDGTPMIYNEKGE